MVKKIVKFVNREISWLSFNERVLQEAADPSLPLLERLKFLGIFSSNQDEFFSVRVGTVHRMIDAGVKSSEIIGDSPKKTMKMIHKRVLQLRDRFDEIFIELEKELEKANISIINETELSPQQQDFVRDYFISKVRPRLVPIMFRELRKFPYLKNQAIYLAIAMYKYRDPQDFNYALIEVPADVLPRYLPLPSDTDTQYIIMLDDIIRFGLTNIFSIFDYDSIIAYTIKLTRDAELDIDDDVMKSFFEKISEGLKQRERGEPVRFVYDREIPEDLLHIILEGLKLKNFENIVPGGRYHNARDFMNFPDVGTSSLLYEKSKQIRHPDLPVNRSVLDVIRSKDVMLCYPYHSFDHMIDLLREAAIDPNVTDIKMTFYRVAKNSNVVNALINAVKNGKSVTVVIELQARFDEMANIYWTQKLEEAGATIIDGVPGLKVHAKLCEITRMENDIPVSYACIGTGNFNEATAHVYSDHSLLTSNPAITKEVKHLFDFFEHTYKHISYDHLIVAPHYMRNKIYRLINIEIRNARAGKKAYMYLKMNNLVDRRMIEKLYDASQAGVKIRMVIRGICSLVPGIKGLSENIAITSIVDKYLEHSRVFIFCNGGDEKYFISSADWMVRNLDRRVEVAVPIYDISIQKELKQFMETQFADNTKARIINKEQNNKYVKRNLSSDIRRSQDELYTFFNDKASGKGGTQ
ncbi:polyphosphate kinase 1 [Methanomethylovorans sp.]|uniref:polyphosphate kinase 1 n=1 Tax=Methanomethylovorans sp. TaxID=2758717 RepID=UPI00351C8C0A